MSSDPYVLDETKLRDRIAKALFDESHLDAPPETIPNEMHPGYYELAQAIIDELGLTMEKGEDFLTWSPGGDAAKVPGGVRIVGKWEKQ